MRAAERCMTPMRSSKSQHEQTCFRRFSPPLVHGRSASDAFVSGLFLTCQGFRLPCCPMQSQTPPTRHSPCTKLTPRPSKEHVAMPPRSRTPHKLCMRGARSESAAPAHCPRMSLSHRPSADTPGHLHRSPAACFHGNLAILACGTMHIEVITSAERILKVDTSRACSPSANK